MDTLPADIHVRPEEAKAADVFRESMVHLVSLLHALALQHLRIDWDLHNITPHSSAEAPPPLVRPLRSQFFFPFGFFFGGEGLNMHRAMQRQTVSGPCEAVWYI